VSLSAADTSSGGDGGTQTFIKSSGVKSLSYAADKVSPIAGGETVEQLEVFPFSYHEGKGGGSVRV
jgi:hypothetical protein